MKKILLIAVSILISILIASSAYAGCGCAAKKAQTAQAAPTQPAPSCYSGCAGSPGGCTTGCQYTETQTEKPFNCPYSDCKTREECTARIAEEKAKTQNQITGNVAKPAYQPGISFFGWLKRYLGII